MLTGFSQSSQDPWSITLETQVNHSACKRVARGLDSRLHFDNFVGYKEEGTEVAGSGSVYSLNIKEICSSWGSLSRRLSQTLAMTDGYKMAMCH